MIFDFQWNTILIFPEGEEEKKGTMEAKYDKEKVRGGRPDADTELFRCCLTRLLREN